MSLSSSVSFTNDPPSSFPDSFVAVMLERRCRAFPPCSSCRTEQEGDGDTAPGLGDPCKTQRGEPLDSRERKQETTTQEMRPCGVWPRQGSPGRYQGGLWALLHAQWGLTHPRIQQLGFTVPAERVRSSVIPLDLLTSTEGASVPADWLLVAQLSPCLCPLQGTIPIVRAQFPLLVPRTARCL